MTPAEKLRLLLIRDSVAYIAFTAYFCLPSPYNNVAVAIAIGAMWLVGKRFKGSSAVLDTRQRRLYFAVSCFFLGLWLALLLIWIIRHSSAPAWCMGSLGIIVLLVLIYASYDTTLGRNAKV
jgi:hypothetical protein